ncbi:hypothetical protein AAEU28_02735 [Pseudoalteromonas sp. SS15]
MFNTLTNTLSECLDGFCSAQCKSKLSNIFKFDKLDELALAQSM